MLKLSATSVATALVLAVSAVHAQPASDLKPKAGEAAPTKPLNAADKEFLQEIGRMRLGEVESSRLALTAGYSQAVKTVAKDILDYHDSIDPKLRAIAKDAGVQLPSAIDKDRAKFLAELKSKSGSDFDKSYMEGQKMDHAQSVELFKKVTKSGQDPVLKSFVTERLSEAEAMQRKVEDAAAKTN